MKSQGSDDPAILVVGEAPGEDEDKQGIPFVGRSGKLLRTALEGLGLADEDLRFTNVVHCRPPDNKISKHHINHCKHFVFEEIEYYKPSVVLLMGNSPLNAVLGESGITNWNGVVVERDGVTYIPLLHPAYVLRNEAELTRWLEVMDESIRKAVNGKGEPEAHYIYPKDIGSIIRMFEYLGSQDEVSYDIENNSLDPFAQDNAIIAVGLAAGNTAYSFLIDHKDSHWTVGERAIIVDELERLLTNPDISIIGHNIKFDQKHTRKLLGIDFIPRGDTMLISALLDSRPGIHSLKKLAGLHLGMYDYDKELKDYIKEHKDCDPRRGGNYGNIPPDVLLPYTAKDGWATIQLHKKLYGSLSDKQKILYKELLMQVSDVLADIEYNGNNIDSRLAARYIMIYGLEMEKLLGQILYDPKVKAYTAYRLESDPKFTFNPNSSYHLSDLYFKYYKMKPTAVTDTGKPSTSAKAMKQLAEKYPIVETIRMYKLLGKMLGTYLEPANSPIEAGGWLRGDGLVSSTYNLHGTVTGRLSSSEPNLQNIPTPEKEPGTLLAYLPVKNLFTHPYWNRSVFPPKSMGVLMSADYSGMELRVFASLAKCYAMIDIHKSGRDFHKMVASMVSGIPYDDIDKPTRYIYKWTNWTLLYGGDENTLVRLYGIPEADAKRTIKQYYGEFPEVLEYREDCREFAEDNGFIESPYGRRERLFYINEKRDLGKRNADIRAAVNMPVQSSASDTLLFASIVLKNKMKMLGLCSKLVNTVHDSIASIVPMDEVDIMAELHYDVMENVTSYASEYFPNVDFSWLICPLKADVDVGTHYGSLVDYRDWVEKGRPEL